ncbi:unnamed protein product [Adineta steineri]|uniref:Uncharacterized protein n=1 Tax=Adineta steineri TaxID=433720 RepID=A0A819TYQ3_9BILA|nr:unnamed protein product [Adineta steineri]
MAQLGCHGRRCLNANCHKCRDWRFTGTQEQWNWVRDYRNWTIVDECDWYRDGWKLFKRRDAATCDDLYYYYLPPPPPDRDYFDRLLDLDPDDLDPDDLDPYGAFVCLLYGPYYYDYLNDHVCLCENR